MVKTWLPRLEQAAWWLLIVLLPFTSFPLVKKLTGAPMVAPASLLVLAVLSLVWLVPGLLRGMSLPRLALPLLAFITSALVSCGLAFFQPIPRFRDMSVLKSEVEALATLAVGALFFMCVAVWPRRHERLNFILRWVNWSGAAIIGWSLLQAFFWRQSHSYPVWMEEIQRLISTSSLFQDRAAGFAFEPSWLAHQLNMLYLPFWLAAAVRGTTVHRLHWKRVTFETLLLGGGLLTMIISKSRVGLLAFLLTVAYLLLLGNLWLVNWMKARVLRRSRMTGWRRRTVEWLVPLGLFVALLVLYTGLLLGAGVAVSRYDVRMKKLFDFQTLRTESFLRYANQLVFAERLVFWQAGYDIFNDHPVLGVGIGNSGFYFQEKLNAYSWSLTEVRTLMYQWTSLPNIKSLWVRILAETGAAGAAFFATWLLGLWRAAAWLRRYGGQLSASIGLAGQFVLVAFLVEGFSVDTFALPYYWVSLGLVAAAFGVEYRQLAHSTIPAAVSEQPPYSELLSSGGVNE